MSTLERIAGSSLLAAGLVACTGDNPAERKNTVDSSRPELSDSGSKDKGIGDIANLPEDAGTADLIGDVRNALNDGMSTHEDAGRGDVGTRHDIGIEKDTGNARDALITTDGHLPRRDAEEGDIGELPLTEDCADGRDNDGDGRADCADPDCADADAVRATFGEDGVIVTMFGREPEISRGGITKQLSCEAYNIGVPFDVLVDGRGLVRTRIYDVVVNVEPGKAIGIWEIPNNTPVEFQAAGRQPAGAPTATIQNGDYNSGQSFEAFFPYERQQ